MALYSGVTGKISIKKGTAEPKDIVYANTFNVSLSKTIREILRFGKDTKEKRAGLKDWTASASGSADFSENGGQRELVQAYNDGSLVTVTFYLSEGVFMEGDALIENLEIGLEADGDATMDISLSGSGEVNFTYDAEEV